jgi:ribonuclease BN (tRNA processing enzyme)
MRLTVLGGSSAAPNPGAGCSGYLVETDGGTRLVLDLGPGTLPELRRHVDMRTLDGIVVSHVHLDHVLDLLALRHALAYNPRPAARPIPVWLPPGGEQFLARAVAPFDECDAPGVFAATIEVREYDPNQALTVGDAVITFAPVVHYVPAWAMRVAAPGRGGDLAYTGDTGPAAALAEFFRGAAVVISEATLLAAGDQPLAERGSLTAAEAGELARVAGANILVLTHLWEELGFAAYRQRAAATFPGRLEVAHPGLMVEW